MTTDKSGGRIAVALAFVGIMFFAIGFAMGVNGALSPVLESSLGVQGWKIYAMWAATFLPFLFFGYPASMTIKSIGYKKTMALSFAMFAAAFGLFIPAANSASFALFIVASFVSGTANCFLQAAVNPYVTILGPIESAAKRISIMGICNKLAWPIPSLFLVWVLGKSDIQISDLPMPFVIIIGVFILLGVLALLAPLSEVKAVGEDEADAADCPYANNKTSIWQFPHLLLGCLALFFYVGAETASLGTLKGYAMAMGLANPEMYTWIGPIGMVIGYICGIIFIPKYISQSRAMLVCAVVALAGTVAIFILPAQVSIWAIGLITLGCSLMWPALWPLAMADLGKFTKSGSSLLIMAMAGPVILLPLLGELQRAMGIQSAMFWVCLPSFLFILYYAVWGYKIRTK